MHGPTQQKERLTYRRDIDGLRAVAVLLVVFNHLRTRFTGGYIGVDVFFVISGYLISSVILSDMNAGKFSIVWFYERRIRRIFPALLVMLLVVSVLAVIYFVPSELENYGQSELAALFSGSNFLFWHQAGYFDAPSGLKPLLHTWSLAVEEQFYIFFPLFLMIVRRWLPRRMAAAIWTITCLSFVAACVWVRNDPTGGFFFAPLRGWELLIGTIVSQRYLPAIQGMVRRNMASGVGLLLILVPALFYTAETTFPGWTAVPPCVGAALIIAAGETGPSMVGSLLGWGPVVFVGLISYSLYLWHWPILVFQNTSSVLLAQPAIYKGPKYAVFAASIVMATLSWRFVETPFRKGRLRPGRKSLFLAAGVATALLTVVGVGMIWAHGLPSRFPSEALRVAEFTTYDPAPAFREGVCFIGPNNTFADFKAETCMRDDPTRKHYLLLGDSHGAHLYPGLVTVFPEINFSQANSAGCFPFRVDEAGTSDCAQMRAYVYQDYLLHHHVNAVLLAGRWQTANLPELGRTISWIQGQGMQVILFGPVIEFDARCREFLRRLCATTMRQRLSGIASQIHRIWIG